MNYSNKQLEELEIDPYNYIYEAIPNATAEEFIKFLCCISTSYNVPLSEMDVCENDCEIQVFFASRKSDKQLKKEVKAAKISPEKERQNKV